MTTTSSVCGLYYQLTSIQRRVQATLQVYRLARSCSLVISKNNCKIVQFLKRFYGTYFSSYAEQMSVQQQNAKPACIERVQALADISLSALCCHSNETRAPIANPPTCAQLEGTPTIPSKYHRGLCSSVGMRQGTDRRTDGRDHYTLYTPHVKCNKDIAYVCRSYQHLGNIGNSLTLK